MGIRHSLVQCRFSDVDFDRLVDFWNDHFSTCGGVEEALHASSQALQLPSTDDMAKLERFKAPPAPKSVKSNFVRLLGANRDYLAGKVFMRVVAGQELGHDMLYCTQNPLRAYFLPVFVRDCEFPVLPEGMSVLQRQHDLRNISLYEFDWVMGCYTTDRALGDMDNFGNVWVFEDVAFKGERRLGGSVLPSPLTMYAARHAQRCV